MKIKLSPLIEKRVRAARERLNSALTKLDTIASRGEKLDAKADALDGKIAESEATLDALDDDSCLRLQVKKTQRDADITEAEQTVFRLYTESQRAIGDAHWVEHEVVRSEAAKSISPFFGADSPQAIGVVEQFPRVRQLGWFCGNAGVADTPSVDQARKLLAMLDALLKGESSFVFVPE